MDLHFNLVKEICVHCRLNQSELAAVTGIKHQRIKDISTGRVDTFKLDEINILVEKLHLNIDWIRTGKGNVFIGGYESSDEHLSVDQNIGGKLLSGINGAIATVQSYDSTHIDIWDEQGTQFIGSVPIGTSIEMINTCVVLYKKGFEDGKKYGETITQSKIKHALGINNEEKDDE